MDDERDNSTPVESASQRQTWPPAPVGFTEPTAEKSARKASNPSRDMAAAVFSTVLAFLFGIGAGGHKDFSESLLGNIAWALFDLLLWSVPIWYWYSVLKMQWRTLRAELTPLRKIAFFASLGIAAAVYGSGLWISLVCLTARAAASDTTY